MGCCTANVPWRDGRACPRDKLADEAGPEPVISDQGACTLCVSLVKILCVRLANIVFVRGGGGCAAEFVQRTRPVANTSNLDKGVKRRRILPPRHGQKLHLAPDGVALNWNSGERRQPGSVFWRQDGPKTGGCHLLKMTFLSAPVHNFRAWMIGKTSLLESACDVAPDPFEKYRLMQVLERDNGLPRHRMFPRQDEHVPLLEQHPAVDTLR
jgi:hypothetical protein